MQRAAEILKKNGVNVPEHQVSFTEASESLGSTSPDAHYHISHDTRHPLYYGVWIGSHPEDPALDVSVILVPCYAKLTVVLHILDLPRENERPCFVPTPGQFRSWRRN